ncbi:MAG: hypothetical protein AAF957_22045 [Planctomycetota bacterium]
MFTPPRCPNLACSQFTNPSPGFYTHKGAYRVRCRPHPIPRFQCKACGRSFSRQTFRSDYRDHKPYLNAAVLEHLCDGLGFRKTARKVGLTRRCLELKARKHSRTAALLDDNLKQRIAACQPGGMDGVLRVHFDEFETYETRRNTRPITIAVAIESTTRLHYAAVAAPIRPRGKMTESRLAAIEREEALYGPRRNRSRAACRIALGKAAKLHPEAEVVLLYTDEKSTYPKIANRVFEGRTLLHSQTPSVLPRTVKNPLFPVNHEEACLRDWMGRLRRESWLVSKKRKHLGLHLRLWSAWRNWVKPRFNRDKETPAQIRGSAPKTLTFGDLAGWRQDWGQRSPSPFDTGRRAIGELAL